MSNPRNEETVDIIDNRIELTSLSGKKTVNIYGQVEELNIYESMYNQTISCELRLADGIDLLNKFPIVGEEYIEFDVRTPGSVTRTYKFFVMDITDSSIGTNDSARWYTLRCVTKDFVKNAGSQYTQRYMQESHSVIEDILRNRLKTERPILIEQTRGIFDLMVSRKRPLQVIDLVRERAVSKKYPSSLFFFFEDRDGYNFTTIENLFASRRDSIGDKEFFFDPAHMVDVREINKRNVLAYTTPMLGDNVRKVRGGSLKSITRSFDVMTGKIEEVDFDSARDFKSFEGVDSVQGQEMNSTTFQREFGEIPAKRFLVVKDTSRPENFHEESIGFKRAFNHKISQYRVIIRVYGDTEITVGDVIKMNVPTISGETGSKRSNEYISDNYIVTSLRHIINKEPTYAFEHHMMLELVKGSFLERV